MPGRKKATAKKTESPELKQLKAIRSELKHIRKELDENLYKPFWKRAAFSFSTGVIKGVGLIIGTTIVAAAVIFLLQQVIDWTGFNESLQFWMQDQLRTVEIVD